MEELETLQRTLRELESVRDYVGVVHYALGLRYVKCLLHRTLPYENISENATREMREAKKPLSATHPAIEQYKALQAFVRSVQETCASAEGGSLALVALLETVQRRTWTGIKDVLASCVSTPAHRSC